MKVCLVTTPQCNVLFIFQTLLKSSIAFCLFCIDTGMQLNANCMLPRHTTLAIVKGDWLVVSLLMIVCPSSSDWLRSVNCFVYVPFSRSNLHTLNLDILRKRGQRNVIRHEILWMQQMRKIIWNQQHKLPRKENLRQLPDEEFTRERGE